jgi:hypothetical protein
VGVFIESKAALVKTSPGPPQAGTKSTGEEDGKRREEEIWTERVEEDGAGRRQQFQIGVFTAFSARPCQCPKEHECYEATTDQFHSVSNGWPTLTCISRRVAHPSIHWNFHWKSDTRFFQLLAA